MHTKRAADDSVFRLHKQHLQSPTKKQILEDIRLNNVTNRIQELTLGGRNNHAHTIKVGTEGNHWRDSDFVEYARGHYHLREVHVLQAPHFTDGSFLALFARPQGDLRVFDVGFCPQMTNRTLTALSIQSPQLEELNLLGCPKITNLGIMQVAQRCRRLKIVNLDWCKKITSKALIALAQNCPRIEEISFADCTKIDLHGFIRFLNKCRALKKIDMYGCAQVTDVWLRALALFAPQLESLDVQHTSITQAALTDYTRRHPHRKLASFTNMKAPMAST